MDLVLGRFADTQLASLTDSELDEVERWLVVPDQQIFAWVTGMESVPRDFDTALFHRLRSFHDKDAV
jgi:antitoxin CptB